MKPARLTWIDYAKGIAIILVLYRHVFEGIKNSGIDVHEYLSLEYANIMLFSFRMPLFFIVSGVFVSGSLQKRGLQYFVATKAKTILYPYFLWGILQITLQLIFSKFANSSRTFQDYLYLLYNPRMVEQFWYLYALFNVTVLYVFTKVKLNLSLVQCIGIGLLLYTISAVAFQNKFDLNFAGDIFKFYLFFAIGDCISGFLTNRDNFKYFESWKLLLILIVPFVFTQLYFLKDNLDHIAISKEYLYVDFYRPYTFIAIALTGCAFVINLSFMLQKKGIMNWLQVLGKHSLYIYVAHVLVLAAVRAFMVKVLGISNVPLLVVCGIVAGLVVPVVLYKLAIKINTPWLFSLEIKKTFSQKAVA